MGLVERVPSNLGEARVDIDGRFWTKLFPVPVVTSRHLNIVYLVPGA